VATIPTALDCHSPIPYMQLNINFHTVSICENSDSGYSRLTGNMQVCQTSTMLGLAVES